MVKERELENKLGSARQIIEWYADETNHDRNFKPWSGEKIEIRTTLRAQGWTEAMVDGGQRAREWLETHD